MTTPTTWIDSPAAYEAWTPAEQSAFRCAVETAFYAGQHLECWGAHIGGWHAPFDGVNNDEPSWIWHECVYRIAKPMEVLFSGALAEAMRKDQRRQIVNVVYGDVDDSSAVRFIEAPKES